MILLSLAETLSVVFALSLITQYKQFRKQPWRKEWPSGRFLSEDFIEEAELS